MVRIFRSDPNEGEWFAGDVITLHHRKFSFFASEVENFSGVLLEKCYQAAKNSDPLFPHVGWLGSLLNILAAFHHRRERQSFKDEIRCVYS
jgi:hypothetical protein